MSRRRGKLLKTKSDKWIAVVVVLVLLVFAFVEVTSSMSDRNQAKEAGHRNTMQLTKKEKTSIEKTVDSFVTTAGTFGMDWSQTNQDTDLEPFRTAWLMKTTSNADMPEDKARAVKTRDQTLTALLQPSENGGSSPLDPSSKMANLDKNDLNIKSDPLWLSGFKVDPESVTINWKTAISAPGDNGRPSTIIDASWKTDWTRVKTVPAAITGTKPAQWDVTTDHIRISNVKLTLNKTAKGDWQVYSMNDEQGSLSLHDHPYVVATSGQVSYDQNGSVMARSQDNSDSGYGDTDGYDHASDDYDDEEDDQ